MVGGRRRSRLLRARQVLLLAREVGSAVLCRLGRGSACVQPVQLCQ